MVLKSQHSVSRMEHTWLSYSGSVSLCPDSASSWGGSDPWRHAAWVLTVSLQGSCCVTWGDGATSQRFSSLLYVVPPSCCYCLLGLMWELLEKIVVQHLAQWPAQRTQPIGSYYLLCMSAKTLQSCPTLCNPMEGSPPGSSVRGILQARILEWVVMPSSRGSSWPRDRTCVSHVSCIGRQVLYYWATWEAPWLLSLILHNIVTILWIGYIGAILTTYQYTVSLPLSTHCPLLLPCLISQGWVLACPIKIYIYIYIYLFIYLFYLAALGLGWHMCNL